MLPPSSVKPSSRLLLATVGIAVFMSSLDVTIVNISLPTISQDFGVSSATVSWVIMAYLLVMCSFLPAFGRLGDIRGFPRVFSTGYLIFVLGSFLCGISADIGTLIGSRMIQGIGASMLSALTSAIVMTSLPPPERGRGLGIVAMFASLGIALGPVIGGYITTYLSWHWIFFINVPVGIIGLAIALKTVPEQEPAEDRRFDLPGAVLIFFALLGIIYVLNQGRTLGWTSPVTLGVTAAAVLFFALFIRRESEIPYRVFNIGLFRNRNFASANSAALLVMLAFSGALFTLPFYLEYVRGFSTETSGLILAIPSIAILVTGPLSGTLSDRIGAKIPCAVSSVILTLGFILITLPQSTGGNFVFYSGLLLIGLGVGGFIPSNSVLIMTLAPRAESGAVSSMMLTIRNTGSTLGVAVFEVVLAFVVFSVAGPAMTGIRTLSPELLAGGFRATFLAGAVISAAACLLVAIIRSDRKKPDRDGAVPEIII